MTTVDIVIPVYNEERALPEAIPRLRAFLSEPAFPYSWRIVIADNASVDDTPNVGRKLADEQADDVGYVRIEKKGRGRALKQTWLASPMDVVSYMDVDLSTGLEAFPPLVRAVASEGYDVAIGSRLAKGARTTRSLKREGISRIYNMVIRLSMGTHFTDAQCGFKALSRAAADVLVPAVENNHWFFDTELLVIAERRGFRIKEVPVEWREDTDTRVKVVATMIEDLKGLARLRLRGIPPIDPPTGEPPTSGPPTGGP